VLISTTLPIIEELPFVFLLPQTTHRKWHYRSNIWAIPCFDKRYQLTTKQEKCMNTLDDTE